jgi:hypothetical protein
MATSPVEAPSIWDDEQWSPSEQSGVVEGGLPVGACRARRWRLHGDPAPGDRRGHPLGSAGGPDCKTDSVARDRIPAGTPNARVRCLREMQGAGRASLHGAREFCRSRDRGRARDHRYGNSGDLHASLRCGVPRRSRIGATAWPANRTSGLPSPMSVQPTYLAGRRAPRQRRTPTAIRYSFSKRACSPLPLFHSSQNASRVWSNSASRSLRRAFERAVIVGA